MTKEAEAMARCPWCGSDLVCPSDEPGQPRNNERRHDDSVDTEVDQPGDSAWPANTTGGWAKQIGKQAMKLDEVLRAMQTKNR